jgi:hypothetical protein
MAAQICCSKKNTSSPLFTINESQEGIELLDGGYPVFFYQQKPKAPTKEFAFNNYLHPLYDLEGDTLTEEFPEDHLHHRGIFWAWHQIYIQDSSVGDGWMMENISFDVVKTNTTLTTDQAKLTAEVLWKSSVYQNGKPFMEEHTSIIVRQKESNMRKIDFEIALTALVPRVEIGGSEDEKGYGGFCARIKMPESLVFTSTDGSVVPKEGQVVAGSWMDFSARFDGRQGENGIAILCHPSTPNYPAPWILRQSGSMQNVVFPGRERIEVSMDDPTVLRYRLIIHDGDARKVDLAALQLQYEMQEASDTSKVSDASPFSLNRKLKHTRRISRHVQAICL